MRHLKNNKGAMSIELIAVVCVILFLIAFAISIAPMFIYKGNQDDFADELMRTAELCGKTSCSELDDKYNTLCSSKKITPSVSWSGTDYLNSSKIQLNDNISLTVTSEYRYEFFNFIPIDFTVSSKSTGTSEQFWKG